MKPRSAKNKGKRLQNEVVALLMERFKDELEDGDLKSVTMGESGEDIQRSPLAKRIFPFSVECKNREKLSIWAALKQAEVNCPEGDSPAIIFKRNRSDIYVALRFEDFVKLL